MVGHPIRLRGLQALELNPADLAPTILRRAEADPIAAVLGELAQGNLGAIAQTLVTGLESPWRFYLPVHRVFQVVLLEAVCDPYGAGVGPEVAALQPRLDPLKIERAGLVIRRYAQDSQGRVQQEGWRTLAVSPAVNSAVSSAVNSAVKSGVKSAQAKLRGWIPLSALDLDPEGGTQVTPGQIKTGRLELDRQLSVLQAVEATYSEQVSPLFVAPPAVCQALGKTLLYGLLPLTSQELSAAENVESAFSLAFVKGHLSEFLRETPAAVIDPNRRDRRSRGPTADEYAEILRQLRDEFELLKDLPTSRSLLAALNRFSLIESGSFQAAGNVLKRAAQSFSERGRLPSLPGAWGVIDAGVGEAIARAVKAILDRRLGLSTPQLNRYDELDREYNLRAFIRVSDSCGSRLWWSDASRPFTLRRWYENTPVPPVQVALPDLIGSDLSQLTPNVAFAVPAGLFNALDGMTLKDLLDGKKPSGGGPALDWICGFNIPIITLCAFIVLNIFLQLLNFLFFWLPFVKICIPIPRPSSGGNSP